MGPLKAKSRDIASGLDEITHRLNGYPGFLKLEKKAAYLETLPAGAAAFFFFFFLAF
jgi:hypothetical protein